jgi:nucleotide-binding universal stress UspA family protein
MKTFLVPVDFSPTSLHAATYAQKFARQIGAKLILVHAYQAPPSFPMVEGMIYSDESLRNLMKEKLDELAVQLDKADSLIKVEQRLMDGSLTDCMKQLTNTMEVFMIIMGITGAGKLKETLIGSNTLDVAKQITVPVLIVPEHANYTLINDIGLTTDFSNVTDTVPDNFIKDLIMISGARLHVLNVDFEEKFKDDDTPLQSGLIEAMFQQFMPRFHFIESENVTEGLSEYALAHSIELLIAVPKKHNLLEKIFATSHTKQMAFHSKVPVLVVHT